MCFVILLTGCGYDDEFPVSGGRWEKHRWGGSYIGAQPAFSPDGASVVYSTPATGHGDLYRYDRHTGKNTRLTVDPEYEGYPVFSPQGKILFVREKSQVGHLWVMDADGSHQKQLTAGPMDESDATYSRDGRSIAFCRVNGGISHVWVMDSDGDNQKQLTVGRWYEGIPRFAPDGKRLVFNRTEEEIPHLQPDPGPSTLRMPEIFVINADGSELRRLTNNRGYDGPIAFSPDGKRIFCAREDEYDTENPFRGVSVMNADGTNQRDIGAGYGHALSPDGRRMVIGVLNRRIELHPPRSIAIMNADGSDLQAVHTCQHIHDDLAFSPGGSQVVFVEWREVRVGKVVILDLETSNVQTVPQID
jgi:Tol biopolymer transport system component